jgi:Collagen triple helix repeat (20 copies)
MSKSKRLTYANVAATLALVFSMSGGALAASKYLITSTKQISPKVLKSLKGKNGQPGTAGPAGAAGKEGPAGKEGTVGKEGKEGPAGSAVAYAHIRGLSEPSALLDTANSKNVSEVSQPFAGGYCITTTVPVKNVSAIPDFGHGGTVGVTVAANFEEVAETIKNKMCPAGTTVLVETGTGGKYASADFWINFN